MGVVVVGSSDWHAGSTIGLMPERVTLNDGQVVYPSAEQKWLLECWHEFARFTKKIAGKRPVVAITNGDLTDNLHHQTTQLWSYRQDEHEQAAVELARVWDFVTEWRVVRGTPAHVARGAQMEERIAKALGCKPNSRGVYSVYDYWADFDGVRMHWAHHRGGNHRPWTEGNAMRVVVLKMAHLCFEQDIQPPHLVFRSHQHRRDDTYHKYSNKIRGIALGGWQLKTEFIHKIDPESLLGDIHGVVIECEGGQYEVHHVGFDLPESMKPQYETWTATN